MEQDPVREAADIQSAKVAAKLYDRQVEALSERTETSTTWVNPDGSLTTDLSAGPIRFENEAGEWEPVDVTLVRRDDGSLAAKSHPAGLTLAGEEGAVATTLASAAAAPARDLVHLGDGDEKVILQWKGGLPEPIIEGDEKTVARYPEALPGTDLIVESTRTGFEQYLEITRPPVDGAFSYTLPLKTQGLEIERQEDGGFVFTSPDTGDERAVMPAPVMWDATTDTVSGDHANVRPVEMEINGQGENLELVLTPDPDFLTDPTTSYPVTVDPSTSTLANVFDTLVKQGETTDWSTNTELHFGNPGTTNPDGTERWSRSFITWDTSPIRDALITNAELRLYNTHSGNTNCAPEQWAVWETGAASTSTRWANQPQWIQQHALSNQTAGRPNCGGPGWITANVSDLVQTWASAQRTRGHMGLRTPSASTAQWKQVRSANAASNPPRLTVTYNYRPRTGTQQEAGPPYFSYGGEYVVDSTTPVLRDTFVDADGDRVNGTFEIRDAATDARIGDYLVSPWVASGTPAEVTVPANVLAHGIRYKFRTSPYDGTHYNLGWSAWKYFTVDTQSPNAPSAITSTDYPTGQWVKGKGQSGTFSVTPPSGSDHHWLEWSLDGVNWTKHETNGISGAQHLKVTPERDGTHTLQVRAVDRANHRSDTVEYTFHVGPGGFLRPSDGERTARRLALVADADADTYNKVTFSWRRAEADSWSEIPPGHVISDDTPLTSWPVPLVDGRNALLVWNAANTVDPDGSLQIKAVFAGPGGAEGSTAPLSVVVDRNASGAASREIGPGSVNLLTGDYSIDEMDASYFGMGVSRTASSRTPDAGGKQEGQAAVFGPEWVSGTVAELTGSDFSHLKEISDTAVAVVTADATEIHFTANAAKNAWQPEPGSENLTLSGSVTGSFTLTDSEGTVTEFTRSAPDATTWPVSSTLLDGLTGSTTTVVSEAVTVDGKQEARPKRVIAPNSAANAAICAATPSTKGCRALEFIYGEATTATDSTLGDYRGRLKEIRLWSTEHGAANATAKTVTAYAYDSKGRLRESWNPLIIPLLKTSYTYDEDGRVTQVTPPGELPWNLVYGQAGNSATTGEGMLLKVTRPALKPGTTQEVQGQAVTTVVYDVPLTGSRAPHAMGATEVRAWGQTDQPTDATAVFPADAAATSHTGGDLSRTDYKRATIAYLGVSGRQVNVAEPGDHITTTEYDRFGNSVRNLTAANRSVALGAGAQDRTALNALGIRDLPSAERAELLSTRSIYNESGTRLIEELGPIHRIELTKDLTEGTTVRVPSGTSVAARKWTVLEYDGDRPTNGSATVRDQVTKVTVGSQVREHLVVQGEIRESQFVYDWVKGLPVRTIQDPNGLALTSVKEYDAKGRTIMEQLPGSSSAAASTQVNAYWSATGSGPCAGRPEWTDLICSAGPAGEVSDPGSHPAQMPTTTYEYDFWGNVTAEITKANGVTRTSSTTHDSAGRPTATTVTGGIGQALPSTTTEYASSTGREITTSSADAGTITREYDALGRQISYTDADGGNTRAEYDLLDRPVRISDSSPSTVTYSYDTDSEPRGLPIGITDSVAGTFRATYNPDGAISTEELPGGFRLNITRNSLGEETNRIYSRDAVTVYSDGITRSAHGQATSHAGWSHQSYRYDAVGRLVGVDDTYATVCAHRAYTFDARANRVSLVSASGTPGSDCPTGGGTTVTSVYDSGDRIVDAGYVYDAFGRTTSLPGGVTLGYYTSDLVYRQIADGQRQTWDVDPNLRRRATTTESASGSTWTGAVKSINHYGGDDDIPRWTIENTATGEMTRNVTSLSGDLAAVTGKTNGTTLMFSNIHGDVALELPLAAESAPTALDYDEYGNHRANQERPRYSWLGSKQRTTEPTAGLSLMGSRLYNPASGRFLSVDPVFGGSANAYEYCNADPINCYDLLGTFKYSYWKNAWWSPLQYHWVSVKFTRSETMKLAWSAASAGGLLAIVKDYVPGVWKHVVNGLRFYAWTIAVSAGYIYYNTKDCASVKGGYARWRGRLFGWYIPPTVWRTRC
ncbi:DNRLRE domain-containing protein [Streptomyces xiamenensis]|nr:DNRLRE domain-containing protein [Streptomyces xiamenensis]